MENSIRVNLQEMITNAQENCRKEIQDGINDPQLLTNKAMGYVAACKLFNVSKESAAELLRGLWEQSEGSADAPQ